MSPETEKAVINIRKELLSEPYHQTDAINILYRLEAMGIQAPSTATINRIIKRNGLVLPGSKNTVKMGTRIQ